MISDQTDFLHTCSTRRVLRSERFRLSKKDRSRAPRLGQHAAVPSPQCVCAQMHIYKYIATNACQKISNTSIFKFVHFYLCP
ncbi:hypothetical protein RHMOL_Rhmol10G0159900 [Rhododendron molle]|uniref:Uncharacterized protein n=1 Tax=Rhododendron molle TaxID=49168 RepID=A0ACC0M4I8_RHOML|nr:hypothetical protein RHMOL_Rhmol10G0159900 [Rhododendron molle]